MHFRSISSLLGHNNSSNTASKNCLRNLQVRLNSLIECAKEKLHNKIANKLNDTQNNAKAYWSLIRMFLYDQELPPVRPFYDDNCLLHNRYQRES